MSELMKIAAAEQPAKRKSKLDPHLADLRRLQEEGYSLDQMRELLKKIGIEVTRQSIYDFLKRRRSTVLSKNEAATAEAVVGRKSEGVLPKNPIKTKSEKALDSNNEDVRPPAPVSKRSDVDALKAVIHGNLDTSQYD